MDDTYNASVESVLAGIDALTAMNGYKVLVFGDMKELGEESAAQHARVGHHAREQGLDAVLTVGNRVATPQMPRLADISITRRRCLKCLRK